MPFFIFFNNVSACFKLFFAVVKSPLWTAIIDLLHRIIISLVFFSKNSLESWVAAKDFVILFNDGLTFLTSCYNITETRIKPFAKLLFGNHFHIKYGNNCRSNVSNWK